MTLTAWDLLATPSKAVTVTWYTLSPSAESMSSKLGPFLSSEDHRSAALLLKSVLGAESPAGSTIFAISKRFASGPADRPGYLVYIIRRPVASSGSFASNTGS